MNHFKLPKKIYFEKNSLQYLIKLPNANRIMIITNPRSNKCGFTDVVRGALNKRKIAPMIEVFSLTKEEEDTAYDKALTIATNFKADTIIALGCAHVQRVAKQTATSLETQLVIIPFNSGNGEEAKGEKFDTRLADVVIQDGQFALSNSSEKQAELGKLVLANAIGSYANEKANDYTKGFSLQAVKVVFNHLEKAVTTGNYESIEHLHNAELIAGIAAYNTEFNGSLSDAVYSLKEDATSQKDIANYTQTNNILEKIEAIAAL